MTDHRGHDYATAAELIRERRAAGLTAADLPHVPPIYGDRALDLAAILAGTSNPSPALLERMVYGPQPLTDASRAVIAEWCE